jgi:hypothetical protein
VILKYPYMYLLDITVTTFVLVYNTHWNGQSIDTDNIGYTQRQKQRTHNRENAHHHVQSINLGTSIRHPMLLHIYLVK